MHSISMLEEKEVLIAASAVMYFRCCIKKKSFEYLSTCFREATAQKEVARSALRAASPRNRYLCTLSLSEG